MAGVGRFGPYVQHGKTYASLETGDDVLTIGLNRAVTLIAEKIAKGPRARPLRLRPRPQPWRASERRRSSGREVRALWALREPQRRSTRRCRTTKRSRAITLEEAVALIEARAAKGGGGSARRSGGRKARTKSETKASSYGTGREYGAQTRRKAIGSAARPKSAHEARRQTGLRENKDALRQSANRKSVTALTKANGPAQGGPA